MKFDLVSMETRFTTIPVTVRISSSTPRQSAKIMLLPPKTEMCKSIMQGEVCQFKDKCKYAHSRNELSHQTLVERRDAGLIGDLTTFRTRPCLDHVMTGSCPFHARCMGIHDVRISSETAAWLPCCQKLNSIPTDVHIDFNRKSNHSTLHHGSTFSKETASMFSSYEHFTRKICQPTAEALSIFPTDEQRLWIALTMSSSSGCPSVIKYSPTHLLNKTPCMVRQVRAFDLSLYGDDTDRQQQQPGPSLPLPLEVPIDEVDLSNPSHVLVHNVSFGQLLDSDAPPPILCFNMPECYFKEYTFEDELKYNRKKKKKKHRQGSRGAAAAVEYYRRWTDTDGYNFPAFLNYNNAASTPSCSSSSDAAFVHSRNHRVLFLYDTNDSATYELIQSTMRLEMDKMALLAASASSVSSTYMHSTFPVGNHTNTCFPCCSTPTTSTSTRTSSPAHDRNKSSYNTSHLSSTITSTSPSITINTIGSGSSSSRGLVLQEEEQACCKRESTPSLLISSCIKLRMLENERKFKALGRFLLDSYWPMDEARELVSQNTPVPPAEGIYKVPTRDVNHSRQWDSFVQNISTAGNHLFFSADEEDAAQMTSIGISVNNDGASSCDLSSSCGSDTCSQSANGSNCGRLRIFEDLAQKSEVLKWVDDESVGIKPSNIHSHGETGTAHFCNYFSSSVSVGASIFNEDFQSNWKQVEKHYKATAGTVGN